MKRITFNKYAGVNIPGKESMELDVNKDGIVTHAERASWLTAMVESGGKFGNVMNYDGTGITAGIHQAIAVFPRDLDSTGTLWELMRDVGIACKASKCNAWDVLVDQFKRQGVIIGVDGKPRNEKGIEVKGNALRELLTGDSNGLMPESGAGRKRAESFVFLFHDLMASPETFEAQVSFGVRHFSKWAKRGLRFCKKWDPELTLQHFAYGMEDRDLVSIRTDEMSKELDLAMCMFWSHSVNAPGYALQVFCKAADEVLSNEELPRVLVRRLATAQYGRWDDDIKNGRYQRTRSFAMQIWPEELFVRKDALMPKDFPG